MWRSPRRCPLLRRTLSSYQDPFDDYKARLAKKLAKQAEAQNPVSTQPATAEKKPGDGMNWFGVKLGAEDATSTSGGGGSGLGGVGKYLNLKRPPQTAAVAEHPKKKKTGFGEFENF
jgi:peptidyl-prolyl cis-trans isomerase-like protein 2